MMLRSIGRLACLLALMVLVLPAYAYAQSSNADAAGSAGPTLPSTGRPVITNRGPADAIRELEAEEKAREKRLAVEEKLKEKRLAEEKARPSQTSGPVPGVEQWNEFQELVTATLGRPLPMFGYNLFDGAPSTFAPVESVPVGRDYVIGPGDELLIRAWGQVDIDYRARVDRNGAIHLPQIGSLTVGGLRYEDLHGFLRAAISRVFRNFELSVNLGQLRSIQVFVVGQARQPGAYTVSSVSTLVNALFASGGPTTKGSMRRIQLKRGTGLVSEFDVYDLLLKGDKSKDVRLMPGDVIYIPPVGELVAITGSVNQPAIYELKGNATLNEVLEMAGGLSTVAAGQKVKIERIVDRRTRQVDELELDKAGMARALRDGDLVQVYAVSPRFENAVTVRGAVATPGRFPWRDGMRVRDLIPSRDALIVPDYWQRLNRAFRPLPGTEMKRTFEEINWDYAVIERLNPQDLTTMLIPFDLGRAVLGEDPLHNLSLRPGDVLTIFSRTDLQVPVAKQTQFVRVEGEIRTPGVYQILPGETLRQLIARVGGFTPNAYLYAAEFTRDSVRALQQKRLDEAVNRLAAEVERTGAARAAASIDDKPEAMKGQTESQRRLIEQMRQVKATGRVVLEVIPDRTEVRDLPELALEDGDRFIVPARHTTVGVIGSVYNQSAFVYDRNKTVGDYLQLAGGFTPSADRGRTYIVRADGTVTGRAQSVIFSPFTSERVHPGDTVVVPENLDRFVLTKELRDWTQIFYQFALGVAGLKVLKDF